MCRAYGAGASFIPAYPALTRWANLWRAYGATEAGRRQQQVPRRPKGGLARDDRLGHEKSRRDAGATNTGAEPETCVAPTALGRPLFQRTQR